MDFKINVVGLGHPTRWHCSLNTDWATEEEAQKAKNYLEKVIEFYKTQLKQDILDTLKEQ